MFKHVFDPFYNPLHPTWMDTFATDTNCNCCNGLDTNNTQTQQNELDVLRYEINEFDDLLVNPTSNCNMNGIDFDSMPTFDTNTTTNINDAVPEPPSLFPHAQCITIADTNSEVQKPTKKRKSVKQHLCDSSIDSLDDAFFMAPQQTRSGDTDKMWIYCTHKQVNNTNGKSCGVHFVRALKRKSCSLQHHCLADINHKYMTRTLGHLYKNCTYCKDGDILCIRSATLDEIEAYQERCKALNVRPNHKCGGFGTITKVKEVVNHEIDEIYDEKEDECEDIIKYKQQLAIPQDTDNYSDDLDDEYKMECNTNEMHQMVRRSQKRMRQEDDDANDCNPLKKAKLAMIKKEREELESYDLDMLLAKALECNPDVRWLWNDKRKWCRYCGSRVSFDWFGCIWGENKLCSKHYEECQSGLIDLKLYQNVEPMTLDEVINPSDCQQRTVLIDLILKHVHQ